MKIDGYRLLHSQDAHPLKMQTYVATFATDEEEDGQEIFGVKVADIPKRPNAIQGGPGRGMGGPGALFLGLKGAQHAMCFEHGLCIQHHRGCLRQRQAHLPQTVGPAQTTAGATRHAAAAAIASQSRKWFSR